MRKKTLAAGLKKSGCGCAPVLNVHTVCAVEGDTASKMSVVVISAGVTERVIEPFVLDRYSYVLLSYGNL